MCKLLIALMMDAASTSETSVNFYQTTRRNIPLIALMMEATSTIETSVNFYQTTRRNVPEDSHLLDLLVLCSVNMSVASVLYFATFCLHLTCSVCVSSTP
jgi:hypothetical protein